MKLSRIVISALFVGAFGSAFVLASGGCQTGGHEGDTCNPLVVQDECHAGLHCTQTTCTYAYCCPTSGVTSNVNCNFGGCPSDDAGDEAGDEAGDDAGSDGGVVIDQDAGDGASE